MKKRKRELERKREELARLQLHGVTDVFMELTDHEAQILKKEFEVLAWIISVTPKAILDEKREIFLRTINSAFEEGKEQIEFRGLSKKQIKILEEINVNFIVKKYRIQLNLGKPEQ